MSDICNRCKTGISSLDSNASNESGKWICSSCQLDDLRGYLDDLRDDDIIMKKLTWKNKCQKCGELKASTRYRTVFTGSYKGPCADSFCAASCTMDSCFPITVTVCDGCEKELRKK